MAYMTDPNATLVPHVGVKATAALLNVWRDNQTFLHDTSGVAGADAFRTTAQTITGTTTVNWTSEGWDVGTTHDLVTNNERITVPSGADGLYLAFLNMRVSAASAGTWPEFTVRIRKNGTTTLAKKTRRTGGDTGGTTPVLACSCSWFGSLAAADYLTATVVNGGTVDATQLRCDLSASWVCRGVV